MTACPAIAITPGDPCGIGPEIIAKAFLQDAKLSELAANTTTTRHCFVAGDLHLMEQAARLVDPSGQHLRVVSIPNPEAALQIPRGVMPVLQVAKLERALPWGQLHAEGGRFAGECVQWAARAALQQQIAAMVTAPLNKEAMSAAGAPFNAYPGHTELLQTEAANHKGVPLSQMPVRMMLANDELRTVLVSIHVAMRQALDAVTYDNVLESLRITHQALSRLLGRPPKIAVAGLNPHAGEGGLFGREEIDILQPAMAQATTEGLNVHGPFAPDTIFMRARKKPENPENPAEFDVVLAMYHDQGLIPVKYLGLEQGVNVTLGLPLVRTSPDHGTAFDIAGKGVADAASLVAAIRMAHQLIAPNP